MTPWPVPSAPIAWGPLLAQAALPGAPYEVVALVAAVGAVFALYVRAQEARIEATERECGEWKAQAKTATDSLAANTQSIDRLSEAVEQLARDRPGRPAP